MPWLYYRLMGPCYDNSSVTLCWFNHIQISSESLYSSQLRWGTYFPGALYILQKVLSIWAEVGHSAPVFLIIQLRRIRSQGLYSLSGKTSHHKISWSLESARFMFRLSQLLLHWTGTSATALPRYLSNFRAIDLYTIQSRGFETSCDLTIRRLVNRGPCRQGWVRHY